MENERDCASRAALAGTRTQKELEKGNWIMNNPRDLLKLHLEVVCKQWARRHWHRRGNCITAPRHTIFMITFSDHVHINNAWKAVWVREVCWFNCCVPVSPHSRPDRLLLHEFSFSVFDLELHFHFFLFILHSLLHNCSLNYSANYCSLMKLLDSWPNNRYLIDGKKFSSHLFMNSLSP